MKIPFDIKYRPQIESGEYKVETRDGRPVRVVCWDRKYGFPICGLATEADGHESYVSCYFDGIADRAYECPSDLFIVTPEPELSEFEKELSKCLCEASCRPEPENYDAWAKEYAPKLLERAKEELQEKVIHDYWKQAADLCVQAREESKAEALKDLPMWRKWESGACGNSDGHPIALVYGAGGIRFVSVLGATGQKYIMLDDLKELPGFND